MTALDPTRTTAADRRPARPSVVPTSSSTALLLLRLAIGSIFIAHGAQKLFVYGFAGTSGSFAEMGVPFSDVTGPVVGLVEFVGGIAVVLGIATRVFSLALTLDMVVAIFLVHLPFGIFAADGGYELPLALIGGALALAIAGAGRISIDAIAVRRRG